MKNARLMNRWQKVLLVLVSLTLAAAPLAAGAHCDSLEGPLVKTARAALGSGNVAPVLAWVRAADEMEIRAAFGEALAARKRSPTHEASDRRFFEIVVRVHRAAEGAPYRGLQEGNGGASEAVRAADRAIETRDGAAVEQLLVESLRAGLRDRFARLTARPPPGDDVAAGRAWVEAYVEYVHHVEGVERAVHAEGEHGAAKHGAAADPHAKAAGPRGEPRADAPSTLGNLQAAYAADVAAAARYAAFAERADQEEERAAAALFRAAARSERIRAQRYAAVIRALGTEPRAPAPAAPRVRATRANLLSILAAESAERTAVYPLLVEQARRDGVPDAILAFTLAHHAEEGLVGLYREAYARPAAAGGDLHVCETCGHVVRGPPPERCPVSLSGRGAFVRSD